jgi:hypothetical protein
MADVPNAGLDAAQEAIVVPATTYYLGLNTADPGQTGANEGGDGRQAITFGSSSAGSQASTDAQTWPSAVGGFTYTNFSVWTLASGGTYVRGGALTAPVTPTVGVPIDAAIGGMTFSAA